MTSPCFDPFLKAMKVGMARMPTSCEISCKRDNWSISVQLHNICVAVAYLLLVNVDFVETVAGLLVGRDFSQLFEDGRDHLARATPRRPEVNEDRLVAVDLVGQNFTTDRRQDRQPSI